MRITSYFLVFLCFSSFAGGPSGANDPDERSPLVNHPVNPISDSTNNSLNNSGPVNLPPRDGLSREEVDRVLDPYRTWGGSMLRETHNLQVVTVPRLVGCLERYRFIWYGAFGGGGVGGCIAAGIHKHDDSTAAGIGSTAVVLSAIIAGGALGYYANSKGYITEEMYQTNKWVKYGSLLIFVPYFVMALILGS